ncbi:endonuclease/exonuclease/phosphatase family protein [Streptomyces sp. WM6378]|uniref:endonuclease/exonuclease/phosphatase family protein n=1 Tax=Streptomyces sp. WM6378 TaxID=1415557 RepID=UPI0006ADB0F1|nr:endonuclease/exonuclease/phosphatase family protein [Streptomyces sp. WM6378]KOU34203.1 membrane protein [Streptomyces sp. WM6378]
MDTSGTTTVPASTAASEVRRGHPGRVASALAGALLLAGVSVVAGCRAADSDGVTPVPQALAFLPWLLVPGGAGLALAALGRWRTGMVWGVAVLAVTGWYTQPYGADTTTPKGPILAEFKVLTSNTEFGWATDDLIATALREKPDLVFVEECSFRCSDALARDLPKADYPYRDVVREDGSAGSAILSRFPLKPAEPIESVMTMPGAVVTIGGRDVRLQLAHPSPPLPGDDGKWRQELGRIREFAKSAKGQPVILAGDFNATQDHALFRSVLDEGALHDSARLTGQSHTWSWPADRTTPLRTQIDHVLVNGDAFKATSARFLKLRGTDHRALLVGLSLYGG